MNSAQHNAVNCLPLNTLTVCLPSPKKKKPFRLTPITYHPTILTIHINLGTVIGRWQRSMNCDTIYLKWIFSAFLHWQWVTQALKTDYKLNAAHAGSYKAVSSLSCGNTGIAAAQWGDQMPQNDDTENDDQKIVLKFTKCPFPSATLWKDPHISPPFRGIYQTGTSAEVIFQRRGKWERSEVGGREQHERGFEGKKERKQSIRGVTMCIWMLEKKRAGDSQSVHAWEFLELRRSFVYKEDKMNGKCENLTSGATKWHIL